MSLPKWLEERIAALHDESYEYGAKVQWEYIVHIKELREALEDAAMLVYDLCSDDMSRPDTPKEEIDNELDGFWAILNRKRPPEVNE